MEILKGMVRDEGYPDVECTYAKIDDNTAYYFIQAGELPNGNIIASTILKEAIGHAPYTSLGVINRNGDILIPFENKLIKQVKDNLLLVEKNVPTTPSVVEALSNKSDPFKATSFIEAASSIKTQMTNAMGMGGDFIFDNQFSEAALYTMDGLNVGNGYYSFISEMNGKYYFSTNVENSQIVKFDPESLENDVDSELQIDSNTETNIEQTENVENEQIQNEMQTTEVKLNIEEEINEEDTVQTENNEVVEENVNLQEEVSQPENNYVEENETVQVQEPLPENNYIEEDSYQNIEQQPVNNNQLTDEDIQNPTILNATNTIKKLLKENREQRQMMDKQNGELDAIKSNYEILKEENLSKEQEIMSLRQELNNYRKQSYDLSSENTKIKSTLLRQSEMMKTLDDENKRLREQVAGIHALKSAVDEASILIEPVDDNNYNINNEQQPIDGITYSTLSSDDDNYQKTMAA